MPYTDEDLEAARLRTLIGIQPEHFSCDNQPVTIGARFWSNDMRVVMITTVARTSNPYQDRCTQTWHDTADGGMFDTLDGDMRPHGRLVRYLDGKDAENYPAGTNYADIK